MKSYRVGLCFVEVVETQKELDIMIKKTENGYIITSNTSRRFLVNWLYHTRKFVAESPATMKSKVAEIIDGFKF